MPRRRAPRSRSEHTYIGSSLKLLYHNVIRDSKHAYSVGKPNRCASYGGEMYV